VIVAVGIDAVEIERIEQLLARDGSRFVQRVFTAAEAAYCESVARPAQSFAARFAAKEAVLKCLRTGWSAGTGFREVEVVRAADGSVSVQLHGEAAAHAARLGIRSIALSLTHTQATAMAFAVASG
jgi:holo-[acyl-carrier protein] synthase